MCVYALASRGSEIGNGVIQRGYSVIKLCRKGVVTVQR